MMSFAFDFTPPPDGDTQANRANRLMDAIELIQDDANERAIAILRELIREDKDFEDAWLWMSVAVESIDQSVVCLDNVLRINPDNVQASLALYRLRASDLQHEAHRNRLKSIRDFNLFALWSLFLVLIFVILFSGF